MIPPQVKDRRGEGASDPILRNFQHLMPVEEGNLQSCKIRELFIRRAEGRQRFQEEAVVVAQHRCEVQKEEVHRISSVCSDRR